IRAGDSVFRLEPGVGGLGGDAREDGLAPGDLEAASARLADVEVFRLREVVDDQVLQVVPEEGDLGPAAADVALGSDLERDRALRLESGVSDEGVVELAHGGRAEG